jgi:hypothetical protein
MEFLGTIAVDSGQILIVDPCYITTEGPDKWDEDYDGKHGYGPCCEATLSDKGFGVVTVAGKAGDGVAVRTEYGDGGYPVYRDGTKIIIDFDPS